MSNKSRSALAGRIFSWLLPIICAVGVTAYITNILSYQPVTQLSINGVPCGYVDSLMTVTGAKDSVEASLSENLADSLGIDEIELDCELEYSLAYAKDPDYLTFDECAALIADAASEDWCNAYLLSVDGIAAGASSDKASLTDLIDDIEAELCARSASSDSQIEITSALDIEYTVCPRSLLMETERIHELLIPSSKHSQTEIGEMNITAFSAFAPGSGDIDPEVEFGVSRTPTGFSVGSVELEYCFVETENVDEVIAREVISFENPAMFVGRTEVYAEGSDGLRNVTYEVRRDLDGNLISRTEIDSETITEPTVRIEVVGTKEYVDGRVGSYIWPCAAKEGVSSFYGWRDLYGIRDFHLGIDMPGDKGDAIIAADGGEVVWAGYTPSYGKSVKIRHDNQNETLYAHLQTIDVQVGDIVRQGDLLGGMGKTGVAYGVHLHFEVRIDSKTVNPLKYLTALPKEPTELELAVTEALAEHYPELFEEEDK